jgi:uncharacterized protein (UPF0332 family)
VTPEATAWLVKSREFLRKSASMLAAGWPDEAGRAAYLAAFHAAQAYIFDRTGKTVKSHAGLHGLFAQVASADTNFDATQGSLAACTYHRIRRPALG